MSEQELKALRLRIDALDEKVLELISERARCAQEVARVKMASLAEGEVPVFYRPEREAQVLKRVMERNQGPLGNEEMARLFREIMSSCLALEQPLKVAYLGPEGTFTQAAAMKHFGHAVISKPMAAIDEVFREVAALLKTDRASLEPTKAVSKYSAVVVDETQDFGPQALKLLRALIAPGVNDLFFVGDGHQRIYSRNKAAMGKCGIDIRGRARKLYINYRTTDEIRRQAVALLEGIEVNDLDDGHDEAKRYRSLSHGPVPDVERVHGLEGAFTAVSRFLGQWREQGAEPCELTFCVVASSEKSRDALALQLRQSGVRTVAITAQSNHTDERGVVYLSTMHRAKGLEFDCVAVVAPAVYVDEMAQGSNRRQLLY